MCTIINIELIGSPIECEATMVNAIGVATDDAVKVRGVFGDVVLDIFESEDDIAVFSSSGWNDELGDDAAVVGDFDFEAMVVLEGVFFDVVF